MANTDFDVAILGTGPVGCAMALSLARGTRQPQRIALIGPSPKHAAAGQIFDPRAIAMNYGSRQFLRQMNAWPQDFADIKQVHVSQAGHLGRTLIDHNELNVAQLGSVVTYDNLLSSLYGALDQYGIYHIKEKIEPPKPGNNINLKTSQGNFKAGLAIISDGAKPHGMHRQYNQQAVLATIQASNAIAGYAFERFTQNGPLALLPHPQAADYYSLVWCLPPDLAEPVKALPVTEFEQQLQTAFGNRLGQLKLIGDIFSFPLDLYAGPSIRGNKLIAVGNAAQTMHPVAGQGLNLGLRDVAQLSHALLPWLNNTSSCVQSILNKYAQQRRCDRYLTMSITDTLPRIFATDNATQRHLCGLGLLGMDLIKPLRTTFARHLLQGQRL